ncbi:MAG: zinc ribbon domain-containing protein [Clostridia bacterium]|nr:zinc ribbon domain-containing protein [Clostridia bacterium]
MAIIKCPECEENISSTVKQCIHCGAKIRFCPECESVFVGNVASCPNCGYAFEQVEQISQMPLPKTSDSHKNEVPDSEDISETSVAALKHRWGEEKPTIKIVGKVLGWGATIITIILVILAYLKYDEWFKSIASMQFEFDMYYAANEVLEKIAPLLIIGMILTIIDSGIDRMLEVYSLYDFSRWVKQKKISFDHILKKSFNEDMHGKTEQEKNKKEEEHTFAIRAKLYAEDFSYRNRFYLYQIFQFALSAIGTFLFYMWAKINVEVLMKYNIEKTLWERSMHFGNSTFDELKFSMLENNWMIVACGILFVLRAIFTFKDTFDQQNILKKASEQYKDASDDIV